MNETVCLALGNVWIIYQSTDSMRSWSTASAFPVCKPCLFSAGFLSWTWFSDLYWKKKRAVSDFLRDNHTDFNKEIDEITNFSHQASPWIFCMFHTFFPNLVYRLQYITLHCICGTWRISVLFIAPSPRKDHEVIYFSFHLFGWYQLNQQTVPYRHRRFFS